MSRMKPKNDTVSIYGVYDREDNIVFVGTRNEVIEELEIRYLPYFYKLIKNDIYYRYKYKIRYLYDEELEELVCRQCGETKPIELFKIRSKKQGHDEICKECFAKNQREWNKKRRNKNGNGLLKIIMALYGFMF